MHHARETLPLPHPHREEKKQPAPPKQRMKGALFLASSFRDRMRLVKPLGLPREGYSGADELSYATGRGQSQDRGEQSAPALCSQTFQNFNPARFLLGNSDPRSTHNSFTKFCRKLKKDENKKPKGAQGFKQLVCNHTTTRAARGGAELAMATATLEPRSRGRRCAAAIPPLLPAPRLQNLGAFSWDELSGVCVPSWSGPHQTRGRQRCR